MALKKLFNIAQGTDTFNLLDQPQLITKATIVAHCDAIWTVMVNLASDTQAHVNEVYDKQLKCHAFGQWLVDALSTRALQKLECSKSEWTFKKDDKIYILVVHGLSWYSLRQVGRALIQVLYNVIQLLGVP